MNISWPFTVGNWSSMTTSIHSPCLQKLKWNMPWYSSGLSVFHSWPSASGIIYQSVKPNKYLLAWSGVTARAATVRLSGGERLLSADTRSSKKREHRQLTLFHKALWMARHDVAATNQQLPSWPCDTSPEEVPSTKSRGSWLRSCQHTAYISSD